MEVYASRELLNAILFRKKKKKSETKSDNLYMNFSYTLKNNV